MWECIRRSDGTKVALKLTNSVAERQDVINECSLIAALNSPHIVSYLDLFDF